MTDLPPDPVLGANKITYTYDAYDRLYLKNYYLGTVGKKKGPYSYGLRGDRIPKKLLYQDVYRYKSNIDNEPAQIERMYQPVIQTPTITRSGTYTLTFKTNITCKSPIFGSGFIYHTNKDSLNTRMLYPDYFLTNPGTSSYGDDISGNYAVVGKAGLGDITWQFTIGVEPSTLYLRAFCTLETGVLFSKIVVSEL